MTISPLPSWLTSTRPHQDYAVKEIVNGFRSGAKIVILDAPPGSGKTLIAELVRRELSIVNSCYICTTKSLQDQFLRDYPYSKSIKGRVNYPTEKFPDRFNADGAYRLTTDDCKGDNCDYCQLCPYDKAKAEALGAEVAVLNTAYWLGMNETFKREFHNYPLTVIDEADEFEHALLNHFSIVFSPRMLNRLALDQPDRKTVSAAWLPWAYGAMDSLRSWLAANPNTDDPVQSRIRRSVVKLKKQTETILLPGLREDRYIYTDYNYGGVTFKPIKVDDIGRELWKNEEGLFLLMSGSVISASVMAEELGIDDHEYESVSIASTFPPENRPVYRVPVAEVTRKNTEKAQPKILRAVDRVIARHPGDRILIHTVSYHLSQFLYQSLRRIYFDRLLTYERSLDRESALEKYKETPASVLIAPSMDRGVDLPGDLCRVQIICKVPFPNLGDKQVSSRLYSEGGQDWYNVQTVRTLVQMTGRGVRSETDHAVTYILDSVFDKQIMGKPYTKKLFPKWWKDGLVWDQKLAMEIRGE